MEKRKRKRYQAFQLKDKWGVLDHKTGELVERANAIERYPETWARNKADQLNRGRSNASN